MSGAIEALLLDAVGTLLLLREPAAAVYVRIAAVHGIARQHSEVTRALDAARIAPPPLEGLTVDEVPAREREGWRAIVRCALGDTAADGPCFDELFAEFARPETWRLAPGARTAIDAARGLGLRVALVSNMDSRLPGVLAGLGLGDAFDALALPSTCGFAKPDPRIFAWALERLGVAADAALYLGDRERDCVEAARRAGLHAWRLDPEAPPAAADRLKNFAALEPRLRDFARARLSG